jgi:hypothetical protein
VKPSVKKHVRLTTKKLLQKDAKRKKSSDKKQTIVHLKNWIVTKIATVKIKAKAKTKNNRYSKIREEIQKIKK